jgi:hypothetical protein
MRIRHETTADLRVRSGNPVPLHRRILIAVIVVVGVSLGCLSLACVGSPLGPAFKEAPPPSVHRGRVYLYRADVRSSLATVHLTLDGRPVGRLRNLEYESVDLAAGTHELKATLRGFGFTAWGWNDHRFRLEPGQTLYLELSVRLTARAAPEASNLEIAGRGSGAASENVFIVPREPKEALPALRATTRRPEDGTN